MKRILLASILCCGFFAACGSSVDTEWAAVGSVSGTGGESSSVSSTSVSSTSGGEGGNMIDPSEPCTDQEDGIKCISPYSGETGVCEQEVCVFCEGKKLGEVVKGYPLDPEACYQFVCKPDLGDTHFAYPVVEYHPLDEACTYKAMNIEGTCSEDGQCCGYVEEAMDTICGPGAN
jgi:hypothetical protein